MCKEIILFLSFASSAIKIYYPNIFNLDKAISLHIRDPNNPVCHCLSSVLAIVADECTTYPSTCSSFGEIILCPQLYQNKSLHSVKSTGLFSVLKVYKYSVPELTSSTKNRVLCIRVLASYVFV